MLLWKHTEYRSYLRAVLAERRSDNPRYSLRAFARDLGVNPPRLSEVLSGKKGLSIGAAAKIAQKLGHSEDEVHHFCDLVRMVDARTTIDRKIASIRVQKSRPEPAYLELSIDTFEVVSEWYHFAILELTSIQGFQSSAAWISRKLRVPEDKIRDAIARLIRLKLLQRRSGNLVRTGERLTTTVDISSEAIRQFNRQIIRRALDALSEQPVAERDYSTMTMAIDKRRLPEAKAMIKKFRRQLSEAMETGDRNDVYCLAVQLFSLTNSKSGEADAN